MKIGMGDLPALSVDLARAARRSDDFTGEPDEASVARAVERYVKWLRLVGLHPDKPLAPARDIDRMWHLHMLHPRAYAADCARILGFLLDHDGGFGAEPEEMPILERLFEETAALWASEYGEPYVGANGSVAENMTKCTRNCVSRCKRACKSADHAPT